MWKFIVFGKGNCDLCDNRKAVISKALSIKGIEAEVVFFNAETPEGRMELSMIDDSHGEIPVVCAYKNEELVKIWDGPKAVVTTRDLMNLLE